MVISGEEGGATDGEQDRAGVSVLTVMFHFLTWLVVTWGMVHRVIRGSLWGGSQ